MAFRKRNVPLRSGGQATDPVTSVASAEPLPPPAPGVRPSPVDGRPTTSTGSPSFDAILGGHAGLPLGQSLLLEENDGTDYAGILLRLYAAEGAAQGHRVHIIGGEQAWGRVLPGLATSTPLQQQQQQQQQQQPAHPSERMHIAWRYERLGQFESTRGA